jgi:hypothetical protein
MAIQPYVSFNTLCLATPVIGQPLMLFAPSNFYQIGAYDMISDNQNVSFMKWTTHVVSSNQQEIRPVRFKLFGYGQILRGAVTLIVDEQLLYTTNAMMLQTNEPYVLLEQRNMESSYWGYELALEFVLAGVGIDIHGCDFEILQKE